MARPRRFYPRQYCTNQVWVKCRDPYTDNFNWADYTIRQIVAQDRETVTYREWKSKPYRNGTLEKAPVFIAERSCSRGTFRNWATAQNGGRSALEAPWQVVALGDPPPCPMERRECLELFVVEWMRTKVVER